MQVLENAPHIRCTCGYCLKPHRAVHLHVPCHLGTRLSHILHTLFLHEHLDNTLYFSRMIPALFYWLALSSSLFWLIDYMLFGRDLKQYGYSLLQDIFVDPIQQKRGKK